MSYYDYYVYSYTIVTIIGRQFILSVPLGVIIELILLLSLTSTKYRGHENPNRTTKPYFSI